MATSFSNPFGAQSAVSTASNQMFPSFGSAAASGASAGGAAGVSGAGLPWGNIIQKSLQFGLAGFQLANSLSAASDFKIAAIAQANQARRIARENNEDEVFRVELTLSRTLKHITAAASSGGFAGNSQSTLAIKNQQTNEAQLLEIQSNRKLDRTLAEIQRQESAALRASRGLKTKAITGFASSIISLGA